MERAPRLSAVFGAVVSLAIGERECLETIKQSAKVILNVLKTYVAVVEWVFDYHDRLSLGDVLCQIPRLSLILRHIDIPVE